MARPVGEALRTSVRGAERAVALQPGPAVLDGTTAGAPFVSGGLAVDAPLRFTPLLSRRDTYVVRSLIAIWVLLLVFFWTWWAQPGHFTSRTGWVLNSVLLFYMSTLPALFLFSVARAQRVHRDHPVLPFRVAFVVTKAPSEPWALVETTLRAMLVQDHPFDYDVWLCDEDPTPEAEAWCRARGVSISSRREDTGYHHLEWPRRTRCKEGNLAYFYDRCGYRNYDIVAQLDADHVPKPGYLREVVRPFADSRVGYVAAPSVCDANAAHSWAARGRLYREAVLHGAVQAGANDGWAPLCFGSHYAVRTQALCEIGGIGPELAEDFTTTFSMNANGWHGAFALDAQARGEGPPSLPAMLVQEFQWARSLTTVLLDHSGAPLARLPMRLRLRFAFILCFYPLLMVATILGLVLAPIAAVTDYPWVHVHYPSFLLRWLALSAPTLTIAALLRHRNLLRPVNSKIVAWEGWLFSLTRWPFAAWGVLAAVMQQFRPKAVSFKVTPKAAGVTPLPARLMLPFAACGALPSIAAILGRDGIHARGYVVLSLAAAAAYTAVSVCCPVLHALETRRSTGAPWAIVNPQVRGALAVGLGQLALFVTAVAVVTWTWLPWPPMHIGW